MKRSIASLLAWSTLVNPATGAAFYLDPFIPSNHSITQQRFDEEALQVRAVWQRKIIVSERKLLALFNQTEADDLPAVLAIESDEDRSALYMRFKTNLETPLLSFNHGIQILKEEYYLSPIEAGRVVRFLIDALRRALGDVSKNEEPPQPKSHARRALSNKNVHDNGPPGLRKRLLPIVRDFYRRIHAPDIPNPHALLVFWSRQSNVWRLTSEDDVRELPTWRLKALAQEIPVVQIKLEQQMHRPETQALLKKAVATAAVLGVPKTEARNDLLSRLGITLGIYKRLYFRGKGLTHGQEKRIQRILREGSA